uniref:Glutamine synthetase-like n=1 Tax=Mastacembelus armatus TaxID=205130 RepID=A0A3Q3NB99_9TELE
MSTLSRSFGLHKIVKQHYLSLAKGAECQVTYIWINKAGENLLCKTRTLEMEPAGIRGIVEDTDNFTLKLKMFVLVPVRMFRDPFTLDPNKLVLCEVLDGNYAPTGSNQRSQCVKVMEKVKDFQPWFGMEQEYMLLDLDGKPFGWPSLGLPFTILALWELTICLEETFPSVTTEPALELYIFNLINLCDHCFVCVSGSSRLAHTLGLLPPWMLHPSRKKIIHQAVTPISAPRR